MPTKENKPKIKVEEIPEEAPEKEKPEEETPRISSFSQLDSAASSEKENVEEVPTETKEKPELPSTDSDAPSTPPMDTPTENTSSDDPKMSSGDVKDWLKDIRPDTTKDVQKGGGFNFKLFFVFVLIFALLGALVGGIFYYKQNVSLQSPADNTDTMTDEIPTETPANDTVTPTTEVSVDLTKYSVNVLNGSGIKGEAGKVQSLLTKAGFAEDKVDAGNANSYDHTTTSVSLKKAVPDEVFNKIKEALGSGYTVEKAVATLNDSSSHDIEIVVGNNK